MAALRQLRAGGPRLAVGPPSDMFDLPMGRIGASGLAPGASVRITLKVHDERFGRFESAATFVPPSSGEVDAEKDAAADPADTYQRAHKHGVLWSLRQAGGQRPGLRLLPRDVSAPLRYEFGLVDAADGRLLDSAVCHRHFVHSAVDRVPVRHGRLRGVLYKPKDEHIGPAGVPCVIDLFGTGGGCIQHRAALLASHGFASFALAYFDYEDLPDSVYDVDLDYFQEAMNWFQAQPWSNGNIGIIGTSLGADIVLFMGCHFKNLKAIVPVNGMNVLGELCPMNYKGKPIPTARGDQRLLLKAIKGSKGPTGFSYLEYQTDLMKNCDPDKEYPIEVAPKDGRQFMFLCSGDDRNSPAHACALRVKERCESHGIATDGYITVHDFPAAGHLLEPPYVPHVRTTYHKMLGTLLDWGGTAEPHAEGQRRMWSLLRDFLRRQLGEPASMPAFCSAEADSRAAKARL